MGSIEHTDTRTLVVHAHWDDNAGVWVAESDDVPGLATEAETAEALIRKLEVIIPELLEANGLREPGPVPFRLLAERLGLASRQ
jgi:predicted RNase H-like HicB family nuclease